MSWSFSARVVVERFGMDETIERRGVATAHPLIIHYQGPSDGANVNATGVRLRLRLNPSQWRAGSSTLKRYSIMSWTKVTFDGFHFTTLHASQGERDDYTIKEDENGRLCIIKIDRPF